MTIGEIFNAESMGDIINCGAFGLAIFVQWGKITHIFREHVVGLVAPKHPAHVNVLHDIGTVHDEGLTRSGRHGVGWVNAILGQAFAVVRQVFAPESHATDARIVAARSAGSNIVGSVEFIGQTEFVVKTPLG